jgi:hypothetical protein
MSAMPERAGPSVLPLPLPRGRPFVVSDLEAMPDDGHRYELIDGTLIVSGAPFSVADLEAVPPDEGHRYELIDGALIVSPAPTWLHQRVVFAWHVCWKTHSRATTSRSATSVGTRRSTRGCRTPSTRRRGS